MIPGVAALNYTDSYAYDLDSNRVQETTDNTNGTDNCFRVDIGRTYCER